MTSTAPAVVDLRSDCLSQPTPAMWAAMQQVALGDDVFDEDPTIHQLQAEVAGLFGMEAALFVPSGTMGNLISVLSHCHHDRGLEVLVGDKSHMVVYEQGGVAVIGGVHTRQVATLPDGTFDLALLEDLVRPRHDPHQPHTALVCVENTHSMLGGAVLPLDWLWQLREFADRHSIPVHMDGARVMNAAVSLDVPVSDILKHVHSVNMCLSKGVGTPVGLIIAGTKEFIARSLRLRKLLGGGMRQPGLLAAAALHGLRDVRPRMARDHAHARAVAAVFKEKGTGVASVNLDRVRSNIVHVDIVKPGLTASMFCQMLEQVTPGGGGDEAAVRAGPTPFRQVRLVLYSSLTDQHVTRACAKIAHLLDTLRDVEEL